ncbi:uncharacterized protein MKK02DRAFT_38628 [Dioszegia hungarica]|uniref:Uncharacterized protein n=1 Tax=Dioszegia hungarica TaxID=4972 RepID=A0AA38LSX9_9TREE|nr:uncharacterized protein MKK02DRAFT_38628 [Dioszegia hungarica]KAI9633958.1 hypothetical protein MKK02DRAFT_38628 [Dioszegia hungarica]
MSSAALSEQDVAKDELDWLNGTSGQAAVHAGAREANTKRLTDLGYGPIGYGVVTLTVSTTGRTSSLGLLSLRAGEASAVSVSEMCRGDPSRSLSVTLPESNNDWQSGLDWTWHADQTPIGLARLNNGTGIVTLSFGIANPHESHFTTLCLVQRTVPEDQPEVISEGVPFVCMADLWAPQREILEMFRRLTAQGTVKPRASGTADPVPEDGDSETGGEDVGSEMDPGDIGSETGAEDSETEAEHQPGDISQGVRMADLSIV